MFVAKKFLVSNAVFFLSKNLLLSVSSEPFYSHLSLSGKTW